MKQSDIVKAHKALQKFQTKDLPLKVTYALHKTKCLIQDQVQFQVDREKALFQKYNPTMGADGSFDFGTQENAAEFAKEFNDAIEELSNMDVDLGEFKKQKLPLDEHLDMTMEDMDALEPFIEFVE